MLLPCCNYLSFFMFFVCVKQLLRYSHGVLIREYILLYKRKCEGQIGNYCRVPYQGTKWHILHRTVGTFKLSCALFICIQNRYFWNVIFLMYYLPFFMKQTSRMVVLHEMSLSYPPIMDDNTRNGENVYFYFIKFNRKYVTTFFTFPTNSGMFIVKPH